MKPEYENLHVVKNPDKKRFELTVDGYTAFIDFKQHDNIFNLIHTESPEALAGRGVAIALIEKTLAYLKENDLQVVPLCPLVFAYIKRHPEWKGIVSPGFISQFS